MGKGNLREIGRRWEVGDAGCFRFDSSCRTTWYSISREWNNGITIRLSARQDILVLPLSRLLRENSLALSSLMRASNLLIKLQLPLSDKYHNSFRGGSVLVSQLVLIVTKLDGIIVMLRMEWYQLVALRFVRSIHHTVVISVHFFAPSKSI